ncbi:MAG: hypothetical protein QXU18_04680 [Thermoplasmatales archaeon]
MGVNILTFISKIFETFIAGMLGMAISFINSIMQSFGNTLFTIFNAFGNDLNGYGWAMPIILIVALASLCAGALAILSVGKAIEDVE